MKYLCGTTKALIVVAFLVFVGCGDVGLLLPVANGESDIRIMSVSKGAILMPEDTFDVSIDYDDSELLPDRMTIDLRDLSGEVLFSVELDQEGMYELPLPVVLPADLEIGTYEVVVSVFQGEEEIASSTSLFFFVNQEYRIRAITAYPQIFYPGGRGLVIADLDVPDNTNPYLRWSSNDVEIYSGSLSSGADRLQLEVPDREGIYSIQLELFPFEPAEVAIEADADQSDRAETAVVFDFSSTISLEAQFFVSTTQDVDEKELGPDSDYYSLFHFRGETVDWGYRSEGLIATPIGTPVLDITRDIFGFRFDGTDGFKVDDVILPVEDGYVLPFSYTVRFAVDSLEGNITTMTDGEGAPVFSIQFSDGVLTASLLDTSSSIEPLIYQGNGADLTLTVLPEPATVKYLWFIGGVLVGDDELPFTPAQIAPGGLTIIGGDGGMLGVLDELGIYFRLTEEGPGVDVEVFEKAMERTYGSDLVLAEGIDGTELPDTITVTGDEEAVRIADGSLFLPAGAGIRIAALPSEFDSLRVEVSLSLSEEEGEPAPFAFIALRNTSADTPLIELDPAVSDDSGVLLLTVTSTDDGLVASHGETAFPIKPVEGGIDFVLENRGEHGELEIQSILVFKNRIQS